MKRHFLARLAVAGALGTAVPAHGADPAPTRLTDEQLDQVTAGALVTAPTIDVTIDRITFLIYADGDRVLQLRYAAASVQIDGTRLELPAPAPTPGSGG